MNAIKTENYEWSHGHKPRGYGLWMFAISGRPGESTPFFKKGTYGEAAKAAKEEAKLIGLATEIVVMP